VTLLRGFRHVVEPSSREDHSHEKGSQCLGHHQFSLALMPHSGDWVFGEVYQESLKFLYPPRLVQFTQGGGALENSGSFLSLTNPAIQLSAVKKAECDPNDVVVRLFNPTSEPQRTMLTCGFPMRAATQLDLEEQEQGKLELASDNRIELNLAPKRIMTLKIGTAHER
jgi:alpha-mannosidase